MSTQHEQTALAHESLEQVGKPSLAAWAYNSSVLYTRLGDSGVLVSAAHQLQPAFPRARPRLA
eukprot:5012975-Alexandrium_andersonii.AAC.1